MSRYAKFCTQCGTALSGELRFCTECGAPVAEILEPAPVPATPVVTAAPPVVMPAEPLVMAAPPGGRSSTKVVALVIGAVLLFVGAGFAIKALTGDDDKTSAATVERDTSGHGQDTSGTDGEDAELVDPGGSEEPDPGFEVEDVECWNDVVVASRELCPPLRGSAAMKWLFPSFERDDGYGICSQANTYDQLTGVNKEVARGCDVTLSDGSNARIVYSQWPTFEIGLQHYRLKYGAADYQRYNGQLNGWNATTRPSGRYQGSQMFAAAFPYSVTVDANSPANVREGFGYVEIRPESETVGYHSER